MCTGCSGGGARLVTDATQAQVETNDQVTVQPTGQPPCIGPAGRKTTGPPPKELSAALDANIVASYAIFRRAGNHALPVPTAVLGRTLGEDVELSGYYPAYIRELGRLPGLGRYFVIPAVGREEPVPAEQCARRALRKRLPEERRVRASKPVYCIVDIKGTSVRALGCQPFQAAEEGQRLFEPLVALREEPSVGLVPDRVSSMRVSYAEAPQRKVTIRTSAFLFMAPNVSARVRAKLDAIGNEYHREHLSLTTQNALAARWNRAVTEAEPTRVEMLDTTGKIVRTVTRSSIHGTSLNRTPIGG